MKMAKRTFVKGLMTWIALLLIIAGIAGGVESFFVRGPGGLIWLLGSLLCLGVAWIVQVKRDKISLYKDLRNSRFEERFLPR